MDSLQQALAVDLPKAGPAAEHAKRQAVLKLFYYKMLRSPSQPGRMVRELESLLQIPDAHLKFTLWHLRQKGWIVSTDAGKLAITLDGVDEVERLGILDDGIERKRIEAPQAEEAS